MKKEYDFSKAKRGAAVSATGKTRITAYLDDAVFFAISDVASTIQLVPAHILIE
jgi:hypothetical protein